MEEIMAINSITQIASEYRKKSFGSREIFETKYIVPFRMREVLLTTMRTGYMLAIKFASFRLRFLFPETRKDYQEEENGEPY